MTHGLVHAAVRRSVLVPAVLVSVLIGAACSSTTTPSPAPAPDAGAGGPVDLVVETYNVGLAGAFVAHEDARRNAMKDVIAASPADVICLQEVWRESDKEVLAAAARAKFPHAARFRHDLDSKVDDPTDESGVVPPAPTAAPCADPEVRARVESAIDCLKTNCSTKPGSDEGQTTSTTCAQEFCAGPAGALIIGTDADKKCYGCMAPQMTTATFGAIRKQCTEDKRGGLAFDAQSGVMILSKLPLESVEANVLPSTWNRRAIARARAKLPNGASIDFYCNHLSPIFSGITYPYTGAYGGATPDGGTNTDASGWEKEQLLQTKKLIAWVKAKSGDTRAVIFGDLNMTPSVEGGPAYGTAALELLGRDYVPGLAAGFVPVCTYCRDNPLTDGAESSWLDHIYLRGIERAKVKSTARVYTEKSVQVAGDGGAAGAVPLSDHYGIRSTVTIDP